MAKGNSITPIDVSLISEYLSYDAESGKITWLVSRGRVRSGQTAGCVEGVYGYVHVRLLGTIYYGHRLAWAMHSGVDIPAGMEIDHRDGNRENNRICNLRLARPIQNKRNMALPDTNTSGHRGVTWVKRRGLWQAQISLKNQCVYLGRYVNIDDAIAARKAAERGMFGEFSFEESRKS